MVEMTDQTKSNVTGMVPSTFVSSFVDEQDSVKDAFTAYQNKIYVDKQDRHREVPFTTNFAEIEASAKQRLSHEAYWYAAGGCSTQKTVENNRLAFDEFRIVPRMMRDVLPKRDLRKTVFGRTLPAPVAMAPIGVHRLYHPDGEEASSRVFGELGLPFTISTVASTGLGTVAKANGEGNPRWYQLYWPNDDELTKSFLKTAKAEGYEVLVVTVDTWKMSWRPYDLDKGYTPFVFGIGTQIGLEDLYSHKKLGFDASAPGATMEQKKTASMYHMSEVASGICPTWRRLKWLREQWGDKPIVLKGIQCAEDAKLALEHGMDGVIVSNHGGRQVDGAIGSLQALPKVVEAVGGKMFVGFDSGVRSGSDIFKAVALGADLVFVGRPVLWGLAHGGYEGAKHVVKSMLADFDLHVGLAGCQTLAEVGRHSLAYKNGDYLVPQ